MPQTGFGNGSHPGKVFLTRSDIDAGTKTLALILVHLAVPDFHLTKPEEAFRCGREQEND